jgi:hypothetical protein
MASSFGWCFQDAGGIDGYCSYWSEWITSSINFVDGLVNQIFSECRWGYRYETIWVILIKIDPLL